MTAVATVSQDDLIGWTRVWRKARPIEMPRWSHLIASLLVVACMTVPDAMVHAKWAKLSLVARLTVARTFSPSA